jgi:hypothetical protein
MCLCRLRTYELMYTIIEMGYDSAQCCSRVGECTQCSVRTDIGISEDEVSASCSSGEVENTRILEAGSSRINGRDSSYINLYNTHNFHT